MKAVAAVALVAMALGGCGGKGGRSTTISTPQTPVAENVRDWMIAVLPEGAQIIVEIDLARLRANPVVGEVVTRLLGGEQSLPGLPDEVQRSLLADADALVLGSYGVGTTQATTVVVLAMHAPTSSPEKPAEDGKDPQSDLVIAANLRVLGPQSWTAQVATRAALAKLDPSVPAPLGHRLPIALTEEMQRLRDHAMPEKAPGAVLRITARLSFDARVSLARQTGLETAPAQISLWADVVDDSVLILDADSSDPGEKNAKSARKQVATSLQRLFNTMAADPAVRALGFANSLAGARFVEKGTWVRAIIEVGPRQLARAMERARAMLPAAP